MKQFINHILLTLFLISSILMGGYNIGPVSVRIYASIILLFWLTFAGYRFPFTIELKLYTFFILFYLFALIANGEIAEIDFFRYFFGRYFVCFISVYVIFSLVSSVKILNKVIFFFIGIGLFNAITSYFQFFGNQIAYRIPLLFYNSLENSDIYTLFISFESGLGKGVFGIFGNVVKNGYLSAVFATLGPFLYEMADKIWKKLIALLIISILFYTVFLTQQRLVFFLTATFYLIYFYKNKSLFYTLIVLLIPFIVFLNSKEISINPEDFGRLSNLNDEGRIELYSVAIEFIKNNIFFGGQYAFGRILMNNRFEVNSAHNFFLNAFIYSGIIGALFVIKLYFKMLKNSISAIIKRNNIQGTKSSIFLAGALVIYLINSLTHNASLVVGDEYIWILFFLMTKSIEFENNPPYKNENPLCN